MNVKEDDKHYIEDFELDAPAPVVPEKKKTVKRPPPKKNLEEEEDVVGPSVKKIPKLNEEDIYKENLPSSDFYEKSFNHKDIINGVVASSVTDQIITMSIDGHIKFWKKVYHLIEFQRHFRAHLGPITGYSLSKDHQNLATVSATDKFLKIFDTRNFDMINMTKLSFVPGTCEYIQHSSFKLPMVAISNPQNGEIALMEEEKNTKFIDIEGEDSIEATSQSHIINVHRAPVKHIKFNSKYDIVISTDEKGFIEYWSPETGDFPKNSPHLKFKSKLDTDLIDLLKHKTSALSLDISPNGEYFAVLGKDKILRVFNFTTGKLYARYDEGYKHTIEVQNSEDPKYAQFKLERIDFERKMAIEKEIDKATDYLISTTVEFDESSTFIIYPTLFGIKVVNFHNNDIVRLIGQHETNERFLKCVLFQGKPMKNPSGSAGAGGASSQRKDTDPTLYCTAFKKSRFYIFSKREPQDIEDKSVQNTRDIFLEKPTKADNQILQAQISSTLGSEAVIETTKGDIVIKLYPDLVPKTTENFVVHSKNGYYNNCIFHRVIKGFMIQTGDPEGNGTGGESIWGDEFEDEFHRTLRHDRPFTVSMANAGPNTNGSQFFITTVPCTWLDNKHTVFGKVTRGMEVVQSIENAETDDNDKPLVNIKIISIRIS